MSDAWILSSTGRVMFLSQPIAADIDIRDIAHQLSLICRFNGACSTFYSVAQHSLYVSRQVSSKDRLWGLLHDAAEAYIGDCIRPVKHDYSPELRRILTKLELGILRAVAERFALPWPVPPKVHVVDRKILAAEIRDLMPAGPASMQLDDVVPFSERIKPEEDWRRTEERFLERFWELQEKQI